jgi:hypothetical protein
MARQKGPLKYVGTIGDIRHFKIKGEQGFFAGMIGGPTGEQIATAEEFQRTRENMNEFGEAIRTAFAPLQHMFGYRLTGNLTATIKKINLEDGSEARGQRAILITQVPQYLVGMDFDPDLSFDTVLRQVYELTPMTDRVCSTLSITAFNPKNLITVPSGASHFRLVNAMAAISDYAYNAETCTYEPKDAEQNGAVVFQYSDYLSTKGDTGAISLEAQLGGGLMPSADVSVLNALGIEFYQKVGDNYYLFASGNALQLVDVF